VTSGLSERAAALELAGTGDIAGAVRILRRLADQTDDPEDRLLLGRLAFVATNYPLAQAQLERAYRDFQAKSSPRRAALAATTLASLFFDGLGEQVVAQGWRARALRLLEHEEPCVEKGYALLGLTGASVPSAEELEADARTALDLAHRFTIGRWSARRSATGGSRSCRWAGSTRGWAGWTKRSR
jgi:hypothetical protein